jgi:hypothetical protein
MDPVVVVNRPLLARVGYLAIPSRRFCSFSSSFSFGATASLRFMPRLLLRNQIPMGFRGKVSREITLSESGDQPSLYPGNRLFCLNVHHLDVGTFNLAILGHGFKGRGDYPALSGCISQSSPRSGVPGTYPPHTRGSRTAQLAKLCLKVWKETLSRGSEVPLFSLSFLIVSAKNLLNCCTGFLALL